MVHKPNTTDYQRLARERIRTLFSHAAAAYQWSPDLSDRYVGIARKIAMRYRVKIPRELRRQFCRYCYRFLVGGINARIRIHRGKAIVTCLSCRKQRRYRLVKVRHESSKDS